MTMTHQDWLRQHPNRIMCGNCKATGVKHAWNKDAILKPVEPYQLCPTCSGTGWAVPSAGESS